jgi:membrane-associated phospholipid phosphatase
VFSFFLLLPCEIYLVRDVPAELLQGSGLIPAMFRWLQELDRPWNAWPSHHACISLVIALFVVGSVRPLAARLAMWVAWGLLALSILTTKQHFAFDLVTGVALGWGTWRLGVRRPLEAADGRPFGPLQAQGESAC